MKQSYCDAIRSGFEYLFETYPEFFAIGQGLWAPWYVGRSMLDLDKKFGKERVIDSPVSEMAVTGAAFGATLNGAKCIAIHPRLDFMLLAVDQIVTQAANWSSMFGGYAKAPLTVRGIINRGGQQGAQHSQAMHAWFAHVPGLRVVMPASPQDARDLLIASVLSDDPVLYIDDRWLYETEAEIPEISEQALATQRPAITQSGSDITLVGAGYTTHLCQVAAEELTAEGINCEVIDLRVINPFDRETILASVEKTGRLIAVDGGWATCGISAEVIASSSEALSPAVWKEKPMRITLPAAPAPSSKPLEQEYFPSVEKVKSGVRKCLGQGEFAQAAS